MTAVLLTTALATLAAVAIHFEALRALSRLAPRLPMRSRLRLAVLVTGALAAHGVEIWLFGLCYLLLDGVPGAGLLVPVVETVPWDGTLIDMAYYSFSAYTSLGIGDVVPTGPLRITTGVETLLGLVLIAWTATFLLVEMQRYWGEGFRGE